MFLTIGGLGDSPLSLCPWHQELKATGREYRHIDVQVMGNTVFAHRVETLCEAIEDTKGCVTLIGQSAGGLAALIAATKYPAKVDGVIAVSPAMPQGISPIGRPLITVMWRYQWDMWRSKLIDVRVQDYKFLALNGVDPDYSDWLLKFRRSISGREALELATPKLQPELGALSVPTLIVFGAEDRWVNPSAQEKLFEKICERNKKVDRMKIPDAGHLPAHGLDGPFLVSHALYRLEELNR